MSDFRIDKITNRDGSAGTQICGVTTFSGTSGMVMPGGPTEYRGGRGRGVRGGGHISASINTIDYITIATTGNAVDFGDLTEVRSQIGCAGGYTKGVWAGGNTPSVSTIMDYVIFSSQGGASDFGDLTLARATYAGTSNGKRGLIYGGSPSAGGNVNVIDYFNIATTGSSSEFGEQIYNQREQGALENSTRSVVAGGYGDPVSPFQDQPGNANIAFISYNLFETKGNTVHFGELSTAYFGVMGSSSETRGCIAGGGTTNVIEYITIATEGDATDFGDLTVGRRSGGGTSNKTRGVWGGGYNPTLQDVIDYVTISSTGNATDFGNLTAAVRGNSLCSDCHGGLE